MKIEPGERPKAPRSLLKESGIALLQDPRRRRIDQLYQAENSAMVKRTPLPALHAGGNSRRKRKINGCPCN